MGGALVGWVEYGSDGEAQWAIGGAPERWGGIVGDRRGAGVMGKARV